MVLIDDILLLAGINVLGSYIVSPHLAIMHIL